MKLHRLVKQDFKAALSEEKIHLENVNRVNKIKANPKADIQLCSHILKLSASCCSKTKFNREKVFKKCI